ncbi:PRC-barrel domain-containing protein [Amphritea pacifica]|uniref:PRC-barrel domain-containing protein n=1 Tax=Amphritea pacifica TaxID=2811233 RepID=A0ABS2W2L2_9GAMM|nr:PRC-barrel domain-containing protein [Amphritea pacifica]MBN0985943.1 hypothetical protein [Amphritea pacifica]MBN1008225.1 hypothetical protein [Amphritea pacifica]
MLRSLKEISDFQLQGTDEEIGQCKDFLFEDQCWVIRYLVADTNKWLPGARKVLISPIALGQPDWDKHQFPVNLTREGVENSPSPDDHQPISHQYEAELFKYYGYGFYWTGDGLWGTYPRPTPLVDDNVLEDAAKPKPEDRHLRSANAVRGYGIQSIDTKFGHIDDFIVDEDNWTIPYIVIDTHNWLPGGRKVLISHESIDAVNWADRSITVKLSTQKIEDSPLFAAEMFNDPDYENTIRNYYGLDARLADNCS